MRRFDCGMPRAPRRRPQSPPESRWRFYLEPPASRGSRRAPPTRSRLFTKVRGPWAGPLTLTATTEPAPPGSPTSGDVRFAQIDAGHRHTLALDGDGRAYAWGYNGHGHLGVGSQLDQRIAVPVDMSRVSDDVSFTQISGGGYHSLALSSDGRAYCLGAELVRRTRQ